MNVSIFGTGDSYQKPPIESSPPTSPYTLYTRRWFVLASFSVLSTSSAWIWITWSPIASLVASYWKVTLGDVDALSGIYLYIYTPCSFVSLYLVTNLLGLKRGLLLGAAFNVAGAWVRYAYLDRYRMVYFGTVLCAIAQTFTLATPPLIAGSWFGATERATATALGVLANQFGTALGLGVTAAVSFSRLGEQTEDESINIQQEILDTNKLENYMAIQLGVSVLAFVLVYLFGGDRPPTPPSIAASVMHYSNQGSSTMPSQHNNIHSNAENTSESTALITSTEQDLEANSSGSRPSSQPPAYLESIQLVFASANNRMYVLVFGMTVGIFYAIPTFLSQLTPMTWSARWNGWLGVLYQFTGVVGSFNSGILVDTTQQHRRVSIWLLCLAFVSLIVFYGALSMEDLTIDDHDEHGWTWLGGSGLVIGIMGTGMCLAAWNTVGIELGTGLVYPVDEAVVSSILESSAELFGFIWIMLGGELMESDSKAFILILGCVVALSAVLLCSTKTTMKRPA